MGQEGQREQHMQRLRGGRVLGVVRRLVSQSSELVEGNDLGCSGRWHSGLGETLNALLRGLVFILRAWGASKGAQAGKDMTRPVWRTGGTGVCEWGQVRC